MFFDPFTFTPPSPVVLSRAVESYQRVAAARFCRYARDAENPDLLPRRLSGDTLEPTPRQLHAEVRALRHLTAIQRTLRDIGGPLFDPASPIPAEQRFRLVDRRLDAIDEALGDDELGAPSEETIQRIVSCPQDGSASSSCSSNPVNLVNPVDSSSSSFYHPPEIEDLLEAVNDAQRVFAARAELLDKRRLTLSPEDFLLEITALRDLTAVVRTLRRMSAQPLPEDQSADDLHRELAAAGSSGASSSTGSSPERSASASRHGESSSKEEAPPAPSDTSDTSDLSDSSFFSSSPRLRPSRKNDPGMIVFRPLRQVPECGRLRLEPSSLRPVPRVPEVRPAVPSPTISSSRPSGPSSPPDASPADAPADAPASVRVSPCSSVAVRASLSSSGKSRKSSSRSHSSLYQEDDPGPWGIWETPPPDAIDESAPEFQADMKRFGYVAAWRRAAERLADAPPADHPGTHNAILNDSDPPPD